VILEALACREALVLEPLKKTSFDNLYIPGVMVASDCLEAVNEILSKNLGPFSHILREIVVLAEERGGIVFRHEGRSFNVEAHRLACMATSLRPHVWLHNRGSDHSYKHCYYR
jgi:hypothetical protein